MIINIWPVKPFETVMVIKGYANKIELNTKIILFPRRQEVAHLFGTLP